MTTSADAAWYRYAPGVLLISGRATVSGVTGSIGLTVPNSHTVATENLYSFLPGNVRFYDTDATTGYHATMEIASSTLIVFVAKNAGSSYVITGYTTSGVPFTWAAGDTVDYSIIVPYND